MMTTQFYHYQENKHTVISAAGMMPPLSFPLVRCLHGGNVSSGNPVLRYSLSLFARLRSAGMTLLLLPTLLFTQVPTITSFTPTSGSIGTTVTINGNNFDVTAANNVVFFGAVKSQVLSAVSTQLTVVVPIGATYAPITIIVNGMTGYSVQPFIVTFTGGGNISSNSFLPKVDLITGNRPGGAAIGDLDEDGKSDLVVTNSYSNTISIFRNINTNGNIISSSFATRVDFATGDYPARIAISDLDGDGKLDLAVTNFQSHTVSVFWNTSTIGSITSSSFADSVNFATGSYPFELAIGDLDVDGKPDLAITNYHSNTVSIFRNTSTIGSISFAEKVDFITGDNPLGVAIGDLDGDGKPDLAVTNSLGIGVSVYRNTSISGIITNKSFTPKVDFISGSHPYDLAISDINGDGKPDIVSLNHYGMISVLQNTSTVGSITSGSFADKVIFTTGLETNQIVIGDLNGDGKLDLAVTYYNAYMNKVSVFQNKSISGSIDNNSFAPKVDFLTDNGPFDVAVADINGDGRPDLVVTNQNSNTISILQNAHYDVFIRVSPQLLNFGGVDSGSSKSQYLKIYNDGTDSSLIISDIISSDTAFTLDKTTLTIPPLGVDSVLVTFAPTIGGIFKDTLQIISNDPNKPAVKVYMKGFLSSVMPIPIFSIDLNGPVYAGLSILGDNVMYAIASGDAIYKMSADGNIHYTLQVGGEVRSSSSIAYDTTVYIASSDRNLYAFSKDGNAVWSPLPLGGVLTATAAVDSVANRLYIGVSNHNFVAVNRTTGLVSWSYFTDAPIKNSAVITQDRKLIFATQNGTLYGFDLNALSLPASPTWQIVLPGNEPSSLALDDQGFVYVGTNTGRLLKISMLTGQQPSIVWQAQTDSAITGSPVIDANGILYVGSTDSKLYAIDIQTGNVKWTFSTGAAIRSTPAISDAGIIYFGNDGGEIYALDSNKTVQWYFKASSAVVAPLLYYNATLYFGTLGGQVIALFDGAIETVNPKVAVLSKSSISNQVARIPMWATFQGNNQRTGLSISHVVTGVQDLSNEIPTVFMLSHNYPNPFNPSTTINYGLQIRSRVILDIYNILGQRITRLIDEVQEAGFKSAVWNAQVPSGIYFYRLEAVSVDNPSKRFVDVKKLLLLK